jgi:uncharacterized protein (DUF488 family)
MEAKMNERTVYTIGHSTRSLDEFLQMLKSFDVQELIDVRTIPMSRYNPQYNKTNLVNVLPQHGLAYKHMPGLGGLRHSSDASVNKGWRNKSFRGYADYMQTHDFDKYLQQLIEEASHTTVAVMCAEAVPWRCHRSLIADALLVHGFQVLNIMAPGQTSEHKLNPMARADGVRLSYPATA